MNDFTLEGTQTDGFYYISKDNNKIYHCWNTKTENVIVYTLEEFLEKYPYKVGDDVELCDRLCTVKKVWWDDLNDEILYMVQGKNFVVNCDMNSLQPYKEEPIECSDKRHKGNCTIGYIQENGSRDMELIIPYNQEIVIENDKYILRDKKPKYPQNLDECLEVLERNNNNPFVVSSSMGIPILSFAQLIVAREAYWKIIGKEMGLDKSWEPDWKSEIEQKFIITIDTDEVCSGQTIQCNTFLSFPTEEMRDAFYENFKELIEQCKELL